MSTTQGDFNVLILNHFGPKSPVSYELAKFDKLLFMSDIQSYSRIYNIGRDCHNYTLELFEILIIFTYSIWCKGKTVTKLRNIQTSTLLIQSSLVGPTISNE